MQTTPEPPFSIDERTPLLLRRITRLPPAPIEGHMTIVTTKNHEPEKGDQQQDRTAPRHD